MRIVLGFLTLLFAASVQAELISRWSGAAYYDTLLDITWVTDAQLALSRPAGIPTIPEYAPAGTYGIRPSGDMNWITAQAWINAINSEAANGYLGVNAWRLPKVGPINGIAYQLLQTANGTTDVGHNISLPSTTYAGSTASEMTHLYYFTLGNKSEFDASGTLVDPSCQQCLTNKGPFLNVKPTAWWSGTTVPIDPNGAFAVTFYSGYQWPVSKEFNHWNAWAVTDGDVLPVDAPPDPTVLSIDIKPGSDPNSINPRSNGVIPIAVLGSGDFDATQIDPTIVIFGPGGASPAHDGHVEDVNEDGFMDAVFHFRTQDTGIACGDTEATLDGKLFDGTFVTGTDTVNTVGCNGIASKEAPNADVETSASSISWIALLGFGVLGLWRRNRWAKHSD